MTLTDTNSVTTSVPVTTFGVFACFESCKLLPYISETTQFNITGANSVSIWELVTVEWLLKVKSILEKSVDNPKSPVKFLSVLDLFRRATAGYLSFRAMGAAWCRELPGWLTEESAEEILVIEREVVASRQNTKLAIDGKPSVQDRRKFWFCDETESVESDLFTAGELRRRKQQQAKLLETSGKP
jgi:hypothetical protein